MNIWIFARFETYKSQVLTNKVLYLYYAFFFFFFFSGTMQPRRLFRGGTISQTHLERHNVWNRRRTTGFKMVTFCLKCNCVALSETICCGKLINKMAWSVFSFWSFASNVSDVTQCYTFADRSLVHFLYSLILFYCILQAVTLHTDLGEIKIELFCERTPKSCEVSGYQKYALNVICKCKFNNSYKWFIYTLFTVCCNIL